MENDGIYTYSYLSSLAFQGVSEILGNRRQLADLFANKNFDESNRFGGSLEPDNPNSTSIELEDVDRLLLDQEDFPFESFRNVACGPTACAMVLDTMNKQYDLEELFYDTRLTREGTRANYVAEALRDNGIDSARMLRGEDITVFEREVTLKHPAIAMLNLSRGGHFVVIDGIVELEGMGKYAAIRDPNGGRNFLTPIEELDEVFSGDVVITKPEV